MLFQGASGYSIGYANDDVWGYGGKTNKSYLIAKYVDRWHPANITDDPYNPATQWVAGYYGDRLQSAKIIYEKNRVE